MQKYQLELPLPSQGLNYLDDSLIGDREAAEGTVNISFKNGMPQTRKGFVKQSLYAHTGEGYGITMLGVHYVAGEKRILFASNGHLYQFNEDKSPIRRDLGACTSGTPGILQLPCALTGGFTYSEKTLVLEGDDLKFFDETNALTTVQAYTPTADEISAYGTNVLSTTPDEIKHQKWLVNDDNRIWIAGAGNLVRISHMNVAGAQPDYWPSTQAIKLPEDCTGLARYRSDVIIFTKNTAAVVTGSTPVVTLDDSYKNIQLPGNYGCERFESIAQGDNAIYWANPRGIYRYTYQPSGFSIPECVSEMVINNNDGTTHNRTIEKKLDAISDWTKVFAVYYDHEYRLYIGGGEVLCFDSLNGTWALYDYALLFNCGVVYGDQLFYAEPKPTATNAFIYEMDKTYDGTLAGYDGLSDDGTAITFTLKSKFFDFGKAANKKRFRKLWLTLYSELISYNIDVEINVDNEAFTYTGQVINKISRWANNDPADDDTDNGFAFGDTINSTKTNLNFPVGIHHRGKRYNIQYTLTSSGLNQGWALKDAVLLMKIKELK
jgi:hypothetical protein